MNSIALKLPKNFKLPDPLARRLDHLMAHVASLPIGKKLWISFGGLVGLLFVVGLITLASLKSNESKLSSLVNDVQPAVVQSLQLVDELDHASAALGFYLLSKEQIHRDDYLKYLERVENSIETLKNSELVKSDPATVARVAEVENKIRQLISYKDRMLLLAEDRAANVPAMRFAGENVNPHAQMMLQALQEILLAEESQPANPKRKKFLMDVSELRHNLVSSMNELRLYLAFRGDEQIENFGLFRENVDNGAKKLANYKEDFLTLEQSFAASTFTDAVTAWATAADELLEIHKAEDWRQDAYIIRKELAPLLLEIQTSLGSLVEEQNRTSAADSQALTRQVNVTLVVVTLLVLFGLLSAGAVGVLLTRAITQPIQTLKESAARLAKGDLNQEIDTSRVDELGSLAKSFADMRDSIRKKIDDLHTLNSTGENLAALHSQERALNTALKVMGDQTRVQYGSVYLYDEDTKTLNIHAYAPIRDDIPKKEPAKSFKLGEGITGGAAATKSVIYVPDISKEPYFVPKDGGPIRPRSIICVPMMDGDRLFGVMNFSGDVDEVKFDDSDEEFAQTIARMTVVTHKNIQMLNVIEEQNRTLEQKVQERTAELHQKTNDINNMLQNMHQGIFTIHPDNRIHQEYSAYLEQIMETRNIAGINVMDLLFEGSDCGSNALDQIKAALAAIMGEDRMMYDCNRHLLLTEFTKSMENGRPKILELDWDPIVNDSNVVEKLMVTVRDVTQLRGLQAEAEHQKWELEIIGHILSVARNKFLSFINTANQFLNENEELIRNTGDKDQQVIATLFRNMHTIKGNARTYGFSYITDAVHEAENTYDRLRKEPDTTWDQELLIEELGRVRELIGTYDNVYRQKLGGEADEGVYVDTELYNRARQLIENVDYSDKDQLAQTVRNIEGLYRAIGTETVHSVIDGIVKSIPDMARQLGKEAPRIIVKDNNIRLSGEITPVLKNILTHSFRNSVDHGLETPDERKAAGKPEQGTITLETERNGNKLILRVYDDGRGLPLAKIRKRAIEKGLFSAKQRVSDKKLAETIFESGVTTADQVSDVSGRGVGMDAVKRFAQKLGGDIELRFRSDSKKQNGHRQFEALITLPAEVGVQLN